jgi:Holliday junction resolvasome RuvABC endonuclease subunit
VTTIGPAVLGIDPSQTAAGIAIIAGGPRHANRPILIRDVGDHGHRTDPWTRRARRIVAQVRRIIAVVDQAALDGADYRLAVIEGPAYANKLPSQFDRAGVFWGLVSALDNRKIPIAVIPPTTRAMFATGHGHADKSLVVTETRAIWADPLITAAILNDNHADALNLASMGVMHLGWSLPFTPRRRHVENITKCEWPKIAVGA